MHFMLRGEQALVWAFIIVSYFSVCISEGSYAMIESVVYERSVPECVKIGYLQQQYTKEISGLTLHSPRFAAAPF